MSGADPTQFASVYDFFKTTAEYYPDRPFLNVLPETAKIYDVDSGEITYRDLLYQIDSRVAAYRSANYSNHHRVGLLLENRPRFFVDWFALNAIGASIVPINPDLREAELRYLVEHSEQCLAITIPDRKNDLIAASDGDLIVRTPDEPIAKIENRPKIENGKEEPSDSRKPDANTEAALLYTSGTTGLPKGCVLTNSYFLNCGHWYLHIGGLCALHRDGERMLTPLPLFHMNALACSVMAMISVGGCLTVLDRFHPSTWWQSVRDSSASIIHYLGVMPTLLMADNEKAEDRAHSLRFGFGAGVDRRLHAPFEERFGFPLVEAWAMTETGNGAVVAASEEPRHIGTSCFGRPGGELQIRLENDQGEACAAGEPGELLVRRYGDDPRYGFFDRYLKDDEATETAWRDGWFHTGDIVRANPDGSLVFVDRKKNVIRRSGENIAAVEVESALLQHAGVAAVAVAATPDEIRGDEVFACIVRTNLPTAVSAPTLAKEIVDWCLTQLAYYKVPGYIAFVDALPLTSTNKVQRGEMKVLVEKLRQSKESIDLRHLKKRQ